MVRTIAVIAIGVGVGFFLLAWSLGHPIDEGFVFAIGVTVALVPEALLPTVTLSLAWGAERMAERQVLVRNLEAVETLGSTTFICTDKTGTLTRNEMTVVEAWTPSGMAIVSGEGYGPDASVVLSDPAAEHAVVRLATAAARCSTGWVAFEDGQWVAHGEPMDAAIDAFARRMGLDTEADRGRTGALKRFAFDPRRRRMAVVVDGEVLVKGAPDTVLPLCGDADGAVGAVLDSLTTKGLRVLAIAGKPWNGPVPDDIEDAESGLDALRRAGARGSAARRCRGRARGVSPSRHQGRDAHGRPPRDRSGDRDQGRADGAGRHGADWRLAPVRRRGARCAPRP